MTVKSLNYRTQKTSITETLMNADNVQTEKIWITKNGFMVHFVLD